MFKFWTLPIGARFDDGVTMWGFVKCGMFTARYFQSETTVFFLPWRKVKVIEALAPTTAEKGEGDG
jgi:hypothetical protein